MTAVISPRVSVAALVAVEPGRRPRLIYRTHRSRRGGGRKGFTRKGFTEGDYAALLDAAHQQLGGPIVLVWNNLSTHTSKAMAELIAARPWLTVYRLPPYGHELNPVEVIWSHLKRSLANLTRHTIAELTALVKTRLRRIQYRPGLLASFLASTGLEFGPFLNSRPYKSLVCNSSDITRTPRAAGQRFTGNASCFTCTKVYRRPLRLLAAAKDPPAPAPSPILRLIERDVADYSAEARMAT
ncbi:transposase [Geodermatophilus sp. URMC 65]